jgi:hypothetical protein
VPSGFLKELPWLLGTFRGTGVEGTKQAPFFERYSLADDSTLIVESFKDSTLTGPIDTTRYEARRDSLSNPGSSRYVATAISAKSVTFRTSRWREEWVHVAKERRSGWYAVITPMVPAAEGADVSHGAHQVNRAPWPVFIPSCRVVGGRPRSVRCGMRHDPSATRMVRRYVWPEPCGIFLVRSIRVRVVKFASASRSLRSLLETRPPRRITRRLRVGGQ